MQKISKPEGNGLFSVRQSHRPEGRGSVSDNRSHKHIYTVSEITQAIKRLLEDKIGEIWLEGEVSNFKAHTSGHLYFSLKDQGAIISAAMFAYANKGLKFKLEDGLKVICFGKINVYGPRSQYQIIVERIEPKGVGAQQLAFEQLKKKLEQEGFFDPAHKRLLPLMPFSVGIVTSSKGAAVRDILQILKKGAPCVDVVIRSVRVQGEQAAREISEAIEELNAFGKPDLIIVSRGGGSAEDLWSFNEEIVARSIYNSSLPVISAVGHQINTTLSDLVADVFVETPSAAAKVIVDKKNALLAQLDGIKYELNFSITDKIGDLKNRLIALTHMLKSPADRLLEKQQLLDELSAGLNYNMRHSLELAKERGSSLIQRLGTLSPLSILSRGYSLSMLIPQGTILKDAGQIKPGDQLRTVLHKGAFMSLVQEVFTDERESDV
ncbi:MAG: exodeoxyribonuclease VII large subunit [Candidatus Omnitrophica bacterium]|nr:exodeoxyribonuclease VII large subunit [Candidatus Omnitrophota bacterium]MBU1923911.1 exodeoxyribonuclease VII large subunit [Candidatus Omnitrophota bacterium]